MALACRATVASRPRRCGGLVSASACQRRFTLPSAWNVSTTGTGSGMLAVAQMAAMPLIQKWAWATSGGCSRQRAASQFAKAGM